MITSRYLVSLLLLPGLAAAESTLTLDSDPGDYIGQGQSYLYNDDTAFFTYSRNYDNGISVRIRNLPGDPWLSWNFDMAAPGDVEIQPGVYPGAERWPFQAVENPGLSFSGQGRGCNTLSGSFEVYEVTYESDGSVSSLAASFVQHCEGAPPALRGEIVFNTVMPVGVSALGLAPYHVVCKNRTTGQRLATTISGSIVDCRSLGLDVQPGDDIQIRLRGTAEE